eukprot:3915464-Pyramimonas_sp.AAC.1
MAQEGSDTVLKCSQDGLERPLMAPRASQDGPRGPQDAIGSLQRTSRQAVMLDPSVLPQAAPTPLWGIRLQPQSNTLCKDDGDGHPRLWGSMQMSSNKEMNSTDLNGVGASRSAPRQRGCDTREHPFPTVPPLPPHTPPLPW